MTSFTSLARQGLPACALALAALAGLLAAAPAAGSAHTAAADPLPPVCAPGPGKIPPWLAKLPGSKQREFTSQQWYQDWLTTTTSLCVDLTQLIAQNRSHTLQWRTDHALTFRGTGTGSHSVPETVFRDGVQPRGMQGDANLKIRPGIDVTNSALSSASYRSRHAKYFGTWIYVVDAPGGILVDAVLNGDAMNDESEVAFVGGIQPRFIVGAFLLEKPGTWSKAVEYRPNPGYRGPIVNPKPGQPGVPVFFGAGPAIPMAHVRAAGGHAADPQGRAFLYPPSATTATLAADATAKDPLYMSWGSVPPMIKDWVAGQQDPSISKRTRPYATCHELGGAEFAPGVGGMVDALSAERRSTIKLLEDKFLMEPGTCYNQAAAPHSLVSTGDGRQITVSWRAPLSGAGQVKTYEMYGRNRDDGAWRHLVSVDAPATSHVLSAAEAEPFTLADLDPARHPGRISLTAGLTDGTRTAPTRPDCDWPAEGAFAAKWKEAGGEEGRLGCPTAASQHTRTVTGVKQDFEHGTLYWSRTTGVHPVWGAFLAAYRTLGADSGRLGLPESDEQPQTGGTVRQEFQGGTLTWDKKTKKVTSRFACAHEVKGSFAPKWQATGGPGGRLKCPTSDALHTKGGVFQRFEGGVLYWSRATGAHIVAGAMLKTYATVGWEQGRLGFPTSDEWKLKSGVGYRQLFAGGRMTWDKTIKKTTIQYN
ncbi:scabin-related ADP-ribosyltransferase [Streptomyces mesophilus]|uniref:scabin-related ADP-ribosyltransferase n=1 Tax=Streptomyces mesophilus TaxID=1775132 RepID=UPI003327503E